MTADRDLDRRVAEEVMGLERSEDQKGMFITGNRTVGCPDGISGCAVMHFGPIIGRAPKYSSDPTACAEVKRRLRDAGIQFAVVDMAGFLVVWVADIGKGTILTHHGKDDPMGEADTEEEAVCRFALACHEAGLLQETGSEEVIR